MKLNDIAFSSYFDKTKWVDDSSVPSDGELMEMEQAFMDVLTKQKRTDKASYRYLFAENGRKVISRIGYCKSKINEGAESFALKRLHSSYSRLQRALKALDRNLYESELRHAIQRGKHAITKIKKETLSAEPVLNAHASEIETTDAPIISGVRGLAEAIGVGTNKAQAIVSSKILEKDGIQWNAGTWKFDRKKLMEFIRNNPNAFMKIKCTR